MELNARRIPRDVLVLGASAGGLEPAFSMIASLPEDLRIIMAVVIHRGAFGNPSLLADLMARRTGRAVVEPHESTPPVPGVVYLGPRDLHIVFRFGAVVAVRGAKQHFTRPAVDPLFVSAAESYGKRVMGVLLSGGGSDGVLGMIRIKESGGLSLVQQPAEAAHPSMPTSALREDHVDAALPLEELVRIIPDLARGKSVVLDGAKQGSQSFLSASSAASRKG